MTLTGTDFGVSGTITIGSVACNVCLVLYTCQMVYIIKFFHVFALYFQVVGLGFSHTTALCLSPIGMGTGLTVAMVVSAQTTYFPYTLFSYSPPSIAVTNGVAPTTGPTGMLWRVFYSRYGREAKL